MTRLAMALIVTTLSVLAPLAAQTRGQTPLGSTSSLAEGSQLELKRPEEVLRFLSDHRRDFSLAAYSVALDGSPDFSDPALAHNLDQPMPLASTIKIISLAVYASEVVAGRLRPDQPIPVADWERFYLPGRDGFAHPAALTAELHLETDEFGFAVDRTATVPLETMIRVMLVYSDNAVPDWLLDRVGRKTYRATIREAGLTGQDLPQSIHGLFLSWINHEQPDLTWRRVMRLLGLSDSQYASHVQALVNAYQDHEWRSAELAWIGTFPSVPVPQESALANGLYPRGTARDYARIMAGVITKTFISDRVSELMLEQLTWPRAYLPESAAPFTVWGNKGGSLPGVLTDANFFVADQGDFAGKPRVAILFMRNLSEQATAAFAQHAGQNTFNRALALDKGFVKRVARTLRGPQCPHDCS